MRKCQRTKKQIKPSKPQESYVLKQLLRDFFASLKKDKIFHKLITNSLPLTPILSKEEEIKENLGYGINKLMGDQIVYLSVNDEIVYKLNVSAGRWFCGNLSSQLHVLKYLLAISIIHNINENTNEFLASFIRYYCKKNKIKAYYNPLMFRIWGGAFYAVLIYIAIISCLWCNFGIYVAFGFALFITTISLFAQNYLF